jgi:hypothetical protein
MTVESPVLYARGSSRSDNISRVFELRYSDLQYEARITRIRSKYGAMMRKEPELLVEKQRA